MVCEPGSVYNEKLSVTILNFLEMWKYCFIPIEAKNENLIF